MLVILGGLSFLLLKPILMSIILGFILVFIFSPLYNWTQKKINYKNLSAGIITGLLIIIITVPLIFLTPRIIDESIKIFTFAQQADLITPLKSLFNSLSPSGGLSAEMDSIIHSFVTKITTGLLDSLSKFLLNLPVLSLQFIVVLFTFFFVIRDKEEFLKYIKSILPFSKAIGDKLLKATRDVTASVLYGQVIIGSIQGLVAGIGFFLFGVPNALLSTAFAVLAGIFPIIGPAIVWLPISIYLFISGNMVAGIGVTIFGIASITIDNFLRPVIVSRRIMMNPLLVLLGMIGGLLLFGILGFILGPLIIAYSIIFLEIYRNKRFSGLLIKQKSG